MRCVFRNKKHNKSPQPTPTSSLCLLLRLSLLPQTRPASTNNERQSTAPQPRPRSVPEAREHLGILTTVAVQRLPKRVRSFRDTQSQTSTVLSSLPDTTSTNNGSLPLYKQPRLPACVPPYQRRMKTPKVCRPSRRTVASASKSAFRIWLMMGGRVVRRASLGQRSMATQRKPDPFRRR